MFINEHQKYWKVYKKEVHCETFNQTIQITMEYNERDASDDEQIVEEDELNTPPFQ